VYGERNGAIRTLGDVTAGTALHERGESAAIEQQDGLLAPGDGIAKGAVKWLAEYPLIGSRLEARGSRLLASQAHVDHLNARQGSATHAVGKRDQSVRLALRI
jgi:hypothetical protein